MAFPTKILLPNVGVLTVSGAVMRTITERWIYGPAGRRDRVSAAKLGNSYQPVVVLNGAESEVDPLLAKQDFTNGTTTVSLVVSNMPLIGEGAVNAFPALPTVAPIAGPPSTVAPAPWPAAPVKKAAQTKAASADVQCAKFDLDDDFTHTGSRPDPALRTIFEYWDNTAPGEAVSVKATPATGSHEITVPDNRVFTIGQLLTANTAFPDGASIVALPQAVQKVDGTSEISRYGTKVILSHKSATSVAEIFSFTGSGLVAWHTLEGDLAAGGNISLLS